MPRSVLILALLLSPREAVEWTNADRERFLESAEVVSAEVVGTGVTETYRVELEAGGVTHAASFQSVDERQPIKNVGGAREVDFVDSYRYNIAGYRLAELMGLADMVPVSVERTFRGRRGAMTWWVDDVAMDEAGMKEKGARPPDTRSWSEQIYRVRLFAELIHDTDRNQGNLLITEDWSLWMIDFTRAFRRWPKLLKPQMLHRCDRELYQSLRGLEREALDASLGEVLLSHEIDGVWDRRELLLQHFDGLIAERGEDGVLY